MRAKKEAEAERIRKRKEEKLREAERRDAEKKDAERKVAQRQDAERAAKEEKERIRKAKARTVCCYCMHSRSHIATSHNQPEFSCHPSWSFHLCFLDPPTL